MRYYQAALFSYLVYKKNGRWHIALLKKAGVHISITEVSKFYNAAERHTRLMVLAGTTE